MGDVMGFEKMKETYKLSPMQKQEVMAEYDKHRDDLNINNKPINEVLTHEWFTKTLPESWEKDNCLRQCKRWCTVDGDDNDT